jgi:hypothetical protein
MNDDRFLRLALRGNATFSTLTGLASIFFAGSLATWMGVPAPALLVALGVGLVGFASFLFWFASRPGTFPSLVWVVVAADLSWVAGTAPHVLADALPRPGDRLAIAIAEVVMLFAVLQAIGIRRSGAARSAGMARA